MTTQITTKSIHFTYKGKEVALTDAGNELLNKVEAKDIETAWLRFWTLFPEQAPKKVALPTSPSMKSRWLKKFREGVTLYGDGVLGLVPAVFRRGNRAKRNDEVSGSSVASTAISKAYRPNCEIRHLASGTVVRKGNVTTHRMLG